MKRILLNMTRDLAIRIKNQNVIMGTLKKHFLKMVQQDCNLKLEKEKEKNI